VAALQHASVLADDDGWIRWVGPAADAPTVSDGERVDCRGRAVIPGLVDAHTHLVWGGHRRDELELRLRGADYEAIFAAGGGILASVRATRAASDDELHAATRRRLERMRACGTTTCEIKSGYGLDLETELRQLRIVRRLEREDGFQCVATCLAAHAVPAELRDVPQGADRWVAQICEEILPAVVAQDLARWCDVFCDRGAFDPAQSRKILEHARRLGLGVRLHANELGPTGGARLAADLGAASADHLLAIDAEDRAALAAAGVCATLLPGTSLVLGKPWADGRALVDAGVPVVVASDCNPGSCGLESLALVLALACYGNRLTPAEALCAATHNAAASLRLDHLVGRIEPGLRADLVVLDTDDWRDLVAHAGSPLASLVIQGGRIVARGTTHDAAG
jgi:imidazolonepropionase